MLDGYIARKKNSCSHLGSILDSIADTIFVFIVLRIFLPLIDWSIWMLCWIVIIAIIRILSLMIGYARFHSIAFLHTYANKITGIMLFFSPIFYDILDISIVVCIMCSVASLSAMEDMLLNITSKELERNAKSIFINK